MLEHYPGYTVISDVGSGINFKRKGLLSLLSKCKQGCIREVVVASRDRLCRFAFELLEWFFKEHNIQLKVHFDADQSPEQELGDDLLSIVQVFCCRRNGKRRYGESRKRKALPRPSYAKDPPETDEGAAEQAGDVCEPSQVYVQSDGAGSEGGKQQ
jgi:predicted site-specific integrase-resolvase